ncbi:hypothetical protein V5F77_00400 [Xanthobacter sp. DSM 24535]|uniref:hypothetical protein n=1 Tax=Roseixanthobacter psychrophilus TaxID=3119917 RepID=UPI00372BEDDE
MTDEYVQKNSLSFSEFVSLSNQSAEFNRGLADAKLREMSGYFTWRSESPDYVYFGLSPFACPNTPIYKDDIEAIRPDATFQCGGPSGQMWSGVILLKARSNFDYFELNRSFLDALPFEMDQKSLEHTNTFIWYSLESNLRKEAQGFLWGKWCDSMSDVCTGVGLYKPIDTRYLIRFFRVGYCAGTQIFLAEVPKYAA